MRNKMCRLSSPAWAAIIAIGMCQIALANELYINEIFYDPPGDVTDLTQEYVELRGTPGMSLDNHYLIFLENEYNSLDDPAVSGPPGEIDLIFDLSGRSLSPTGFLSFRQKGTPHLGLPNDEFHLVNTGAGEGWGLTPADNTLGVWSASGDIENSGFTAMLIRNDSGPAPSMGMMLDGSVDNDNDPSTIIDGLDHPDGQAGWIAIDSIGIFSERNEAVFGRTYSPTTFGRETAGQNVRYIEETTFLIIDQIFEPNIVEGQTYVATGHEVEMIARWGNSTGQGPGDWHVTNITDDVGSGYQGGVDFRQSCIDGDGCHPTSDGDINTPAPQPSTGTESNQGVAYGTKLLDTIGKPNYITGDYNKDGVVDAADYTLWRNTLGQLGTETNHPAADPNHDFVVDEADYAYWKANYGAPFSTSGGGAGAGGLAGENAVGVPEPTSWAIASLALAFAAMGSRRSR